MDPRGTVCREYVSVTLSTSTRQMLKGLVVSSTDEVLTFADAHGQSARIAISNIEVYADSDASLMPENQYRPLTRQQQRDLFAWRQRPNPSESMLVVQCRGLYCHASG